ncbi:MAG: MMPL family transporter [Marinilabiliaceae bacterium]|nr:MMPL family transporter [Marinilabiliaceae bacterium]
MITKVVLRIYQYLAKHRKTRITALVISSLLFISFGVRIEYEEDITKLLPSTNNSDSGSLAFANLRVKDKIFLLISSQGEEDADPDELAEITDTFITRLQEADTATKYIDDILYQMDEETLLDAIGYLSENFPSFIDADSYEAIDTLLTDENIARIIESNYKALTSSSAMVMKDLIACDPIGVRNILINKVKEVRNGLGSNQTLYNSHFFTPDTTIALAYISPGFKSFDSKSGNKLIEMLENEIDKFVVEYPNIKIQYHGSPVQSVYNSRQVKKDLSLTLSISLVIIFIVIWLCFKNKSTIPMLLLPVGYGAFFALAMMYFIKGTMSLMALGIGAIVLGVALSYCLHIITHYKYVSTPERVLQDQAKPIFLGSLTTVGSFLGLMLTQSDLLRDFGLFASFSLIGTTTFCLIFLPHFFNPQRNRKSKKAFKVLERLNSHPFEQHRWLIALIVIVAGVCLYTQRWVSFDANLKNISYYEPKISESVELLASKTQPGQVTTYYAASSHNLDSALLISRKISATCDSLKAKGLIKGYSKASSLFLTEDEAQENIDAWKEYWTPERITYVKGRIDKECAKYGLSPKFYAPFFNMIEDDLEPQSLYEAEIIPSGIVVNIIEHTDSVYVVFTPAQMPEANKSVVGKAIDKIPGCLVVDPMFYTEAMVNAINDDFNIALRFSMAFVFIVLLLSYRNILLSLIAFLPVTLSWYIVLGMMGIMGMQFNLVNIIISTFIFGIGVDYSIFVMDGLLSKARSQSEPRLLIYHKTAIFFSVLVLIISTGSLLFATHPALKSIGVATIVGLVSALLLAYTLQPYLYHALVRLMIRYKINEKWLLTKRNKKEDRDAKI